MRESGVRSWPKQRPVLTDQQRWIFSDWYQYWLSKEGMQGRFGWVDRFGHEYAARTFAKGCRTLDIGAGNGAHLKFEEVASQEYTALERSPDLIADVKRLYPSVRAVVGDCQEHMDFPADYFDRVLAIHVLEHLDNLPATLVQVNRILRPGGKFSVVLPCEGGWLYSLGRKFSSERMFTRRYHVPYEWMIKYDHVNTVRDVLVELNRLFDTAHAQYFPFLLRAVDAELVLGLTCMPRK